MQQSGSITRRINIILILSLTVGIGMTIAYYAGTQYRDLLVSTQDNLDQQSAILYQSIKNAMLPGQASVAVELFDDIGSVRQNRQSFEISLYRANGTEAFSDNATIQEVNTRRGDRMFEPREEFTVRQIPIDERETFGRSVARRQKILIREPDGSSLFLTLAGDRSYFTLYNPLINLPGLCTRCHGSDHTVRGLIRIRSDITATVDKQRRNLLFSSLLFVGIVVVLTLVLTLFIHGHVINPVKHIRDVCALVTGGDFTPRVMVHSRDEIGVLGDTVNTMVEGLHERFELSKYVSASTIESLRNSEAGTNALITVFFSDIRGFTAYSERREADEVVDRLNRVLNAQTEIIHREGGDVDKYVGDEVVAMFTGDDQALKACRCALAIQREMEGAEPERFDGLRVGIGVNTGSVILGMIGSERRADYTVTGDHVNLGSRLCSVAKAGQIVISEHTYARAQDHLRVSRPYRVSVKGKTAQQRVYLLAGLEPAAGGEGRA